MRIFRSKSAFIEAVRWSGDVNDLAEFLPGIICRKPNTTAILVTTPEGDRLAEIGDWIVRDAAGAHFPMDDDLFGAKYEPL